MKLKILEDNKPRNINECLVKIGISKITNRDSLSIFVEEKPYSNIFCVNVVDFYWLLSDSTMKTRSGKYKNPKYGRYKNNILSEYI